MPDSAAKRHPRPTVHLIWALPVLLLAAAWAASGGGVEVSAAVLLVPALVGLAVALFFYLWEGRLRRDADQELELRTEELGETGLFLQDLVDSSPDAILVADGSGRVTFTSLAAERLLGGEGGSVVGTPVSRFFRDGKAENRRVYGLLERGGGKLSGHRTAAVTRDGREVPISLSARDLTGTGDRSRGFVAVFHDLTERLEVEEKMMEAERLRLMGESVAGIAHELNNPLTGVIGYLQLALKDVTSSPSRGALEKASREAERMAHTIRTLLDFVRRREPERVPTDLNALARQVKDFQEYQLEVLDIAVELDLAEIPLALVDPHQVRQVLLNLLKNAEQAIREGGVGSRIAVRTLRYAQRFRIEVEDDGSGIRPENRERIFEHFFTTKASGRGTGLGLSICRRIVEAHGGSIRVDPAWERGARFVIDLPVPVAEAADVPEEGVAAPDPRGLTVLVVDDEDGVREYVGSVLREAGYDVVEASSGDEAVAKAHGLPLDLAIVDLKMPGMSGPECLARIRDAREGDPLRAILMSGDSVKLPEGQLFLAKPMTADEILDVARRASLRPA